MFYLPAGPQMNENERNRHLSSYAREALHIDPLKVSIPEHHPFLLGNCKLRATREQVIINHIENVHFEMQYPAYLLHASLTPGRRRHTHQRIKYQKGVMTMVGSDMLSQLLAV